MNRLSRRSMLQICGLTAMGALAGKGFGKERAPPVALRMRPADYGAVTLLDGPMREQFRAQHATLLAMDEDALLKPFRQAAGLAAPGEDLGGWYSASADFNPPGDLRGYIPGHSFGQYVSSLSRAYAVTGHEQTRQKVLRLNSGLATAITQKFYSGYPLLAYTFDKINVGLIDAHAFARDTSALDILNLATDAALPYLPEKALTRPEMAARPHPNVAYTWDESYPSQKTSTSRGTAVQASVIVPWLRASCWTTVISSPSREEKMSCPESTRTATSMRSARQCSRTCPRARSST